MPNTHDSGGETAASPADTLQLNLNRPGVRRLSPRMIAALGVVLGAVLMAAFVIGFSPKSRIGGARGTAEQAVTPASENVIDTALMRLPEDYTFDPREPEVPSYGAEQEAAANPSEESSIDPAQTALLEARQRQLERLRSQHEEAIDSPVEFAGLQGAKQGAMRRSPAGGPTATQDNPSATSENGPNRRDLAVTPDGFLARDGRIAAGSVSEAASPYTVHAGTVLPGVLVTAIHSDLPGLITGQVTEHIYDSVTGQYLLVPQGSRLVGRYSSLVSAGQNRLLIAWDRLILPNGDSVALDTPGSPSMPGTDALGRAGLADRVDYHVGRIGLATALSTVIAYAGNLANPAGTSGIGGGGGGRDGTSVVGETVAQQAAQLGQRIIDRELDLPPTVTIRPGTRFHVLVSEDLVLRPYPQP